VLRIDQKHVDGVDGDSRRHGVVHGRVNMARSCHVVCVAKGVQTQARLERLRVRTSALPSMQLPARIR
jgi:EAL domain-containing protein (putative c-di-GMP-specific phosphodiesterase class I)